MRFRVAVPAALLIFVLLILLTVCCGANMAKSCNSALSSEMECACRVLGASTENADMQARKDAVSAYTFPSGVSYGLFDSEKKVIYASDRLVENENFRLPHGKAIEKNYEQDNYEGNPAMYAIYLYEDGAFLALTAEKVSGMTALLHGNGMVLALVFIVLAAIGLIAIVFAADSEARLVNRAMHALDDFADGNFDARLEPVRGNSMAVTEYNAIIGRIQSRVFQQRSHNHALSVVMSQMQNGIIAVDQDLKVILVTAVAKKLLGIVGNPEGQPITEASKDVRLDDVFIEAMNQPGVYTNDVAARTTMGRGHRPLRLYVSPMRNDGKVVGALAMVEDITELRRLEQVRTDFAANVSHELKTPLTSIRGFVETLEAGAIDNPPMAHKFLRIIMMETERLTRLINDILSISKLESGDDEVAIERIRLDKVAFDVCDMLSIHASEKEVEIHSHLNEKPKFIMGNPDRVEQMLINLVENAIKYNNPGGSVTVQVFANEKEANVTVSDTGIGIAEENLPRLFERFYRVDKGRSRQMGGTGLGLAIVKHIVRSMNGEIEVHSKLGEGTEFLITLPLAPKQSPEKDTIFDD